MKRCRCHCSACGRHFAGVTAFDAHRAGSHQEGRYCDLEKLEAVDEAVRCENTVPAQEPVTMWNVTGGAPRPRFWEKDE